MYNFVQLYYVSFFVETFFIVQTVIFFTLIIDCFNSKLL